jgi:hypothetical protein
MHTATKEYRSTDKPKLTPAEEALMAELVEDGLNIQERFRPDPLYKQRAKGDYEGKTVQEVQKANGRKNEREGRRS